MRTKTKVRSLVLAAVTAATSVVVLAPQPAVACERQPCYTRCDVNEDYVSVDENGTITIGNRLVDCYY